MGDLERNQVMRFYGVQDIIGDRKKGIAPIVPVSHATFWAWWQQRKIPQGRKCGARRLWTDSEVGRIVEFVLGESEVA